MADRPHLGPHMRRMYRAVNCRHDQRGADFLEKKWNEHDAGTNEGQPTNEEKVKDSAMNNYEVAHWNRLVARDDFEHKEELAKEDEARYVSGLKSDFWDLPSW